MTTQLQKHRVTIISALMFSALVACEKQTQSQPETAAVTPEIIASAPEKKMHPSWDKDGNGINDCENDDSCDHTVDYTQARPEITAATTNSPPVQPSFDCTQIAEGSIESMICSDRELTALDNSLATVYATASEKAKDMQPNLLPAEQRGWIKGRNECWKSGDKKQCVTDEYRRRIYELQARYALVTSKGAFRFVCGESPANELIVTFYETEQPTLIAERGDSVSLMYLQPSGSGTKYQGRNESFWEHQGEATVTWGYDTPEFMCKKVE
jgi:uncharacterized protein